MHGVLKSRTIFFFSLTRYLSAPNIPLKSGAERLARDLPGLSVCGAVRPHWASRQSLASHLLIPVANVAECLCQSR